MAKPDVAAIGDFTIEKTISRSGMSSIHVGYLPAQPDYKVAIKLHMETASQANLYQDYLRHEADYLKQFRHPNVIRIFPISTVLNRITYCARDAKLPGQPWYFAMEYLTAGDLRQYSAKFRTFPIPWLVELFYQLVITVQFLHRLGYGHCDLKPDNVLFREVPDPKKAPLPILTDFGTVHPIGKPILIPARSMRYSPPEIILASARKDIQPSELNLLPDKIDIWSLGAILFELLTGRALFYQRNDKEITTSILNGEIDEIHKLRPDASSYLDVALKAMLKRAPEERPTIDDIVIAFEEKISSVRPPRIPISQQ
jgi:eukaryotic-like serine/threonine-protein kinase